MIPSIVCLLLSLQWGGVVYPWSNWRCILLLGVFGITLIFWVYVQYRRRDRATVPLRIIRQRSVGFGAIYTMAAFGAATTMLYYLPIWFQAVRGVSALKAGVDLCPLMLSWAVVLVISAQLVSKHSIWHRSYQDIDEDCRLLGRDISCHNCLRPRC